MEIDISAVKPSRPPCILTSEGTYFDFTDPESFEFSISAIAHSLSMLCRFTGHVKTFYSVAQHCVAVSHEVPPEMAYFGLMHDAAEAFLGDMSSPLKSLMSDYKQLEIRVETALAKYYGLPLPGHMPPEIRHADLVLLATEKRDLMCASTHVEDCWRASESKTPLPNTIRPLRQYAAYELFMERYIEVAPKSMLTPKR